MPTVISVEHLSKSYRLGQIGTGTFSRDLEMWWSKLRGKPNPFLRIGETDHGNRDGEDLWALKDVSFTVEQGEVLGIIGRNGAGKSTLLKILSRVTAPTSGKIKVKGRVASLLEVGTGFHPELTGRENIYLNGAILGMSRAEIDHKFDEIVDFAEVEKFIETPVKRFSSGMYVRLAFAVAAHLDPEILVVDEVLAVGDAAFQKKCLGKMGDVAEGGRTVLLVSHNLTAIQNLCKRTAFLENGELHLVGNTENVLNQYIESTSNTQRSYSLSERRDRRGNQFLRFTRVVQYNAEGREISTILSGQDVCIRLYFIAKETIKSAAVLVAFDVSDRGYVITNINTRDSGYIFDIYQKGYFECRWPNLNLISGSYSCTIFCSINGEVADWVESAFSLTVENGDYFKTGQLIHRSGSVLIPHSWSINKE